MNKQLKKELPYIISFLLFVMFIGWDHQNLKTDIMAKEENIEEVIVVATTSEPSPIVLRIEPTSKPIVRETRTRKEMIIDYIEEEFGEHSDKALLLLKGDVKCRGENPNLDERAVYKNKKEDGTIWSEDRGIFQINSVFHPLTEEQAFDYKQNIHYAWRMFENDDFTFRRWTAGRCLGI